MKVKWLGHAAFYFQSPAGLRVLTDPFGPSVPYPPLDLECDVVTISHEHFDHNDLSGVKGSPVVLRGLDEVTGRYQEVSQEFEDVSFTSFPSFHDDRKGADRGENAIFLMELGDFKVAHLGDLGHYPEPWVMDALKGLHLLFIPIGGHFTIGSVTALDITKALKPKIVVPMHYLTSHIDSWEIKGPEEFLNEAPPVQRVGKGYVQVTADQLPIDTKTWVFDL